MKLIAETLVSRSSMEMDRAVWMPVLRVNYGTERRYRRSPWDFFGLFDKRETEWENDWVTIDII